MTQAFSLDCTIQRSVEQDDPSLSINCSGDTVAQWCALLTLLNEGLCSTVTVYDAEWKNKIIIENHPLPEEVRSQATISDNASSLKLTRNDLGYLLHYFLKSYRDRFAEVDHIDIQIESDPGQEQGYVTFHLSDFQAPVSAEVARKRLGLADE